MFRICLAQAVSTFGDYMSLFGILSVVTFRLHGSAEQIAFLMVIFLLPQALISPVAGVLIDRWNVRLTMIASDVVRGFLVLGFVVANHIPVLSCIFLALSLFSCLFAPAQAVAIKSITPPEGLMAANGLIAQAGQIMPIIVPGLAGSMIQHLGANSCFLIDSLSFFFSAAMVLTITIRVQRTQDAVRSRSFLLSLREGVQFIINDVTISVVTACIAISMFALRCFGVLLTVYIRDILRAGAALFGFLNSVIAIGMIVAAYIAPLLARRMTSRGLMACGFSGMSFAILFTATTGHVTAVVVAMFVLGVSATVVAIPAQTVLLRNTPGELVGRVSSSLTSILNIAQVIALMAAAPIAQTFGIRRLYLASGLTLLIVGVAAQGLLRRVAVGEPLVSSGASSE